MGAAGVAERAVEYAEALARAGVDEAASAGADEVARVLLGALERRERAPGVGGLAREGEEGFALLVLVLVADAAGASAEASLEGGVRVGSSTRSSAASSDCVVW